MYITFPVVRRLYLRRRGAPGALQRRMCIRSTVVSCHANIPSGCKRRGGDQGGGHGGEDPQVDVCSQRPIGDAKSWFTAPYDIGRSTRAKIPGQLILPARKRDSGTLSADTVVPGTRLRYISKHQTSMLSFDPRRR